MGPHEWHALRQVAAALTGVDARLKSFYKELQDRIFQTRCTFHSLEHELKGKKTEESFPSFLCTICPSRGTDAAALHTHTLYAAETLRAYPRSKGGRRPKCTKWGSKQRALQSTPPTLLVQRWCG